MSHLSRETKALLERGREGEPLPEVHRRRLKRAVLLKAGVASLLAAASPAAAWTSSAVKIVAVVSAIAVTGTVAVVGIQAARGPAPATRSVPQPPPPSEPAPAPVAGAPSIPPAPAALRKTEAPLRLEARSVAPPPVHTQQARLQPSAESAAPTAAPAPSSSLSSEARLLRDAHEALANGDAAGALRVLDEHAARFPASMLEPERSAERVFALCLAGRVPEARAAAGDFLARHPSGPLSARVRASCGGSPK